VFLSLDHRDSGEGPPLVFETMVFPLDSFVELYCERYSTWAEAEAGHAETCERAKAGEFKPRTEDE
jgi:hypothetical protein